MDPPPPPPPILPPEKPEPSGAVERVVEVRRGLKGGPGEEIGIGLEVKGGIESGLGLGETRADATFTTAISSSGSGSGSGSSSVSRYARWYELSTAWRVGNTSFP